MGNLIEGSSRQSGWYQRHWAVLAVFSLSFGNIAVAEEEKKKKTRRVPAISQSLYKQISEAQIMIDPDSIPREEGEPAPEGPRVRQEMALICSSN